jgi:hypothetical protein
MVYCLIFYLLQQNEPHYRAFEFQIKASLMSCDNLHISCYSKSLYEIELCVHFYSRKPALIGLKYKKLDTSSERTEGQVSTSRNRHYLRLRRNYGVSGCYW